MLDKIKGGLFGVAIGDALGGTTEFMTKEEIKEQYNSVTELIGGGYWRLKPGETTDDTAMTIAVAKGIISNFNNPIEEIGKQFIIWRNSNPKDIGMTIQTVFQHYNGDWFQATEEAHHHLYGKSAGNGSLMRSLPVALAYTDKKKIDEISVLQSKMTHYDDFASETCVIYNQIARRVLDGEDLQTSILSEIKNTRYEWNYEEEPDCPPNGYVVHTMKWVIYWLLSSKTFEEVVVGAANMGNDSDTIAAIAGGIKGIEVGYGKLPDKFKEKILYKKVLTELAMELYSIRETNT